MDNIHEHNLSNQCFVRLSRGPGSPTRKGNNAVAVADRTKRAAKESLVPAEIAILEGTDELDKRSFQRKVRNVLYKSKSYETIKKLFPDIRNIALVTRIELIHVVDREIGRITLEENEELIKVALSLMGDFKQKEAKVQMIKLVYSCKNKLILKGFNEKIKKMDPTGAVLKSLEGFVSDFKIFEDFQAILDWLIANKISIKNLLDPNFKPILSYAHAFAFLQDEEFKFVLCCLNTTILSSITVANFSLISKDLSRLSLQQRQKVCTFYRLYQKHVSTCDKSHLQTLIELSQLEDNQLNFIDKIISKYFYKNIGDAVQIIKWVQKWPINANIENYLAVLGNLDYFSLNGNSSKNGGFAKIMAVILSNGKDDNEIEKLLESLKEYCKMSGNSFFVHFQHLSEQNILAAIKDIPDQLAKFKFPFTRGILGGLDLRQWSPHVFRDFLEDLGNTNPAIQIYYDTDAKALIQEFEKTVRLNYDISVGKLLSNSYNFVAKEKLSLLARDIFRRDRKALGKFIKTIDALDSYKRIQIFNFLDSFLSTKSSFSSFEALIAIFDRINQDETLQEKISTPNYEPILRYADKFSGLDRQAFDFLVMALNLFNSSIKHNELIHEMLVNVVNLSPKQRQNIKESYMVYEDCDKDRLKLSLKFCRDMINWIVQLQMTSKEIMDLSQFFLFFVKEKLHINQIEYIARLVEKQQISVIAMFLTSKDKNKLDGSWARLSSAIFDLCDPREYPRFFENFRKLYENISNNYWRRGYLPFDSKNLIGILENIPNLERFTDKMTRSRIADTLLFIPSLFYKEYNEFCNGIDCNTRFDSVEYVINNFLRQKNINIKQFHTLLLKQLGASGRHVNAHQMALARLVIQEWPCQISSADDPLYQRANEIHSIWRVTPEAPLYVYKLFDRSLINQINVEPLIKKQQVAGYYCRFNIKTFQNLPRVFSYKFSDLPPINRNFRSYFSGLDGRLGQLGIVDKQDASRAIDNFINQVSSGKGKGNYALCKEVTENHFLADMLKEHHPDEPVNSTLVKLYTILHYLQSVSGEVDHTMKDRDILSRSTRENEIESEILCKILSERDKLLIHLCWDLNTCPAGMESVIATWYKMVPQDYRPKGSLVNYSSELAERQEKIEKDSKQQMEKKLDGVANWDKKKELFLREMNNLIQMILEKKIRDRGLLNKLAGTNGNAREQPSHQITYIKNLIAPIIGLTHEVTFDAYTHLITEQLFNKGLKEVVEVFYDHFRPQDIVDALVGSIREDAENVQILKTKAANQNQEAQKDYEKAKEAYETRVKIMQEVFSTGRYEAFLTEKMGISMQAAKAIANDDRFCDINFLKSCVEEPSAKPLVHSRNQENPKLTRQLEDFIIRDIVGRQIALEEEILPKELVKQLEDLIVKDAIDKKMSLEKQIPPKEVSLPNKNASITELEMHKKYLTDLKKYQNEVEKPLLLLNREIESLSKSTDDLKSRYEKLETYFRVFMHENPINPLIKNCINKIEEHKRNINDQLLDLKEKINLIVKASTDKSYHQKLEEISNELGRESRKKDLSKLVNSGSLQLIRNFFMKPNSSKQVASFRESIDQSALWITKEDEYDVDQIVGIRADGAIELWEIAGYLKKQ